jgi:hypothetical protein
MAILNQSKTVNSELKVFGLSFLFGLLSNNDDSMIRCRDLLSRNWENFCIPFAMLPELDE